MHVMWNISASIAQRKVGMESSCKFQPHLLVMPKYYKPRHKILMNHNLQSMRLQNTDRDRNMVVCCSVGPGPSIPDPGSCYLFQQEILGFWNCDEYNPTILEEQMGAIVKTERLCIDEVESVINKVETMADIVEKVAEQVEEVADGIGNQLPEGRLKDALEFVEDIADHTADGARLAGQFIDKVEEVEEKVETWMEQSSSADEEAIKKKNKNKKNNKKKRKKEEEEEEEEGQI